MLVLSKLYDALQVTVVSSFPLDNPPANYKDVYVEMPAQLRSYMSDSVATAKSTLDSILSANVFPTLALQFGNDTINSSVFQKMMAENTYDLVILPFMVNDFHSGIAAHFKCPLVVICPIGNTNTFNTMIGNPLSVASASSIFLNYPTPMSFEQRLKNFGMAVLETVIYQAYLYQAAKYYE
jgi:glucuronosyltransferase